MPTRREVLHFEREDAGAGEGCRYGAGATRQHSGSLRAPEHVAAWAKFKDMCAKSGFCRYASGHQLAAGICIYGDAVVDLIDYFNEKFADVDTEPAHNVDFVFDPDDPRLVDLCWELDKVGDILSLLR